MERPREVACEALGAFEWAGLGLVIGGILLIALPIAPDAGTPLRAATGYALATGLLIGAYSINDGLGVRAAESPLAYVVWLNVACAVPFTAFALVRKRHVLAALDRKQIARALGASLLGTGSYAIAVLAARTGKLAHVAALRETSVVFAVFIGALVLREPAGVRRYAGAALVAAGLVLMRMTHGA